MPKEEFKLSIDPIMLSNMSEFLGKRDLTNLLLNKQSVDRNKDYEDALRFHLGEEVEND